MSPLTSPQSPAKETPSPSPAAPLADGRSDGRDADEAVRRPAGAGESSDDSAAAAGPGPGAEP